MTSTICHVTLIYNTFSHFNQLLVFKKIIFILGELLVLENITNLDEPLLLKRSFVKK